MALLLDRVGVPSFNTLKPICISFSSSMWSCVRAVCDLSQVPIALTSPSSIQLSGILVSHSVSLGSHPGAA